VCEHAGVIEEFLLIDIRTRDVPQADDKELERPPRIDAE
jgi:hypothetical protein